MNVNNESYVRCSYNGLFINQDNIDSRIGEFYLILGSKLILFLTIKYNSLLLRSCVIYCTGNYLKYALLSFYTNIVKYLIQFLKCVHNNFNYIVSYIKLINNMGFHYIILSIICYTIM